MHDIPRFVLLFFWYTEVSLHLLHGLLDCLDEVSLGMVLLKL